LNSLFVADGSKKLYVGNVPFASTKEELRDYFGQYGQVVDVFVPVNTYGDPRGFAFVSMKDDDVDATMEATNGVEFMGRALVVNIPLPPGEKPIKRGK
jgi:RNA recognition motif-containing protein